MTDPTLLLAIGLSISVMSNIQMLFYILSLRAENKAASELAQTALDAEARTEERMTETQKIHQELLARPVQVMIGPDFVQNLGNAIIQYLDSGNSGPAIIYPSKKDKPS